MDGMSGPVGMIILLICGYMAGVLVTRFAANKAQKRRVHAAFGRLMSPEQVEVVSADRNTLKLGGELRPMTVLFLRIRNFSSILERLDPAEACRQFNSALTPITKITLSRNATIDKYIFGGVMSFWNAPLDDDLHALNACRAALAMKAVFKGVGSLVDHGDSEMPLFDFCIGIASGGCVVGNMGTDLRMDYSVLGASVAVAHQISDKFEYGRAPVIIGAETAVSCPSLAILPLDNVRLPDHAHRIEIFALLGDEIMAQRESFQVLLANHRALREACGAKDWALAMDMAIRLKAMAPGDLGDIYDGYAAHIRAIQQDRPPEGWDASFLFERRMGNVKDVLSPPKSAPASVPAP